MIDGIFIMLFYVQIIFFQQVEKAYKSIDKDKSDYIADQRKQILPSTEYVPYWVIIAVAFMIGIGTMIDIEELFILLEKNWF